jgi:cathepsin L
MFHYTIFKLKLNLKLSSCWAFAAIGALEPAVFKKTGQSLSLSEQQLVDCTYRSTGHDGCQGGWMFAAYSYLHSSIGSDTKSAYAVKFKKILTYIVF